MRVRVALLAAVAALAAAAPAPARASVTIDAARVVVRGAGGSVTVTRAPFSLTYRDRRGHTVLASAPAAGRLLVEPPVPRQLFGRQDPPRPALYAPLSFMVGTQRYEQTLASQWEGTLISTTAGGVEYRADRVVSARRAGAGVELVLSTTDPTGRRLIVFVAPAAHGMLRSSARPSPATGVATMAQAFATAPGEAFRGFGGRHDSLDQRGRDLVNFNQQENVSSGSASGLTATTDPSGDRYMFPNGSSAAYAVQSLFVSSRPYGFLLDRSELSDWRMASDRADAWRVGVAAPGLDALVAPGSARTAIKALSATNGRHSVPPRWALGHELDRLVRFPSDPADHYAAEVRADLANMKRYHLPVSAYRIEGWQFLPRKTLAGFIRTLRRRHIHPLVYFRLFVGKDDIGTDSPAAYDEALAKGYVATKPGGGPYVFGSNFNSEGAQIDFTNPAAVRWWKGRITAALALGADGFMQDFGEQVLSDMRFHDGSTGAQMHNRLPTLAHRATAQAVAAFEKRHPKRSIWWYTRSSYSGTPGSAAYEPANFPGDETTDWTRSSGLASQTTDMLNRSLGGAWGFTTDIGGFFDVGPYQATSAELFTRWAQWAALSPFFRLHGSVAAGTHMPWSYGAATLARYRAALRLHLKARPLITRLWKAGRKSGIGPMRPLWLAEPGSQLAAAQDQEWLLGPDVLVAPIVTEGARSRRVYFPRGCWKRPGRYRAHHGPVSATVPAPLGRLPYYVRCGKRPLG